MLNITFSFTLWVWQHFPKKIRRVGEFSVVGRFIYSLLLPIKDQFIPTATELFAAVYEHSRTGVELTKTGILYVLTKSDSESDADFLIRIQKKKVINRSGNTKKAVKEIITMMIGVEAEIFEAHALPGFVVGKTTLGIATCAEASFYMFVFKIILPDLSDKNINHDVIRQYLDEYSPNNEFLIFENRSSVLYAWQEDV